MENTKDAKQAIMRRAPETSSIKCAGPFPNLLKTRQMMASPPATAAVTVFSNPKLTAPLIAVFSGLKMPCSSKLIALPHLPRDVDTCRGHNEAKDHGHEAGDSQLEQYKSPTNQCKKES